MGLVTRAVRLMKTEDVLRDFEINNCRVCFDIKDWKEKAQRAAFRGSDSGRTRNDRSETLNGVSAGSVLYTMANQVEEAEPEGYRDCPPDAMELGRSTWTFLHTMSVYYPEAPNEQEKTEMGQFLRLFSKFYPCSYCAEHLRDKMAKEPPVVDSRSGLARWLCRIHNEVNERLGKPVFDCEQVEKRWRDGPDDGSCN